MLRWTRWPSYTAVGQASLFHTPYIAIIVYATLVFVFTISGAFRPLAVLATISQLLVYFVVCVGVLRLRSLRGSVSGGFRTPGGPVVPLIGAAAVVWLLSHSTAAEVAVAICGQHA